MTRRIALDPSQIDLLVRAELDRPEVADLVEDLLWPGAIDGVADVIAAVKRGKARDVWDRLDLTGAGVRLVAYEPRDDKEDRLLDELRDHPADEAARAVYADWLEEQGDSRADFVRHSGRETVGHPMWRALIVRTMIEGCNVGWETCTPTRFDNLRMCSQCGVPVHYVVDELQVTFVGRRGHHHLFDPWIAYEVAREKAIAEDELRRRAETPTRIISNPPPPSFPVPDPVEPRPTILTRIGRWFRK